MILTHFIQQKLALSYEVTPLFDLSISAEPSQAPDRAYVLDIDITNTSPATPVDITAGDDGEPAVVMPLTDKGFRECILCPSCL